MSVRVALARKTLATTLPNRTYEPRFLSARGQLRVGRVRSGLFVGMIRGVDCRFRRGLALELLYAKACNDKWSILITLGMPITAFRGNSADFKSEHYRGP